MASPLKALSSAAMLMLLLAAALSDIGAGLQHRGRHRHHHKSADKRGRHNKHNKNQLAWGGYHNKNWNYYKKKPAVLKPQPPPQQPQPQQPQQQQPQPQQPQQPQQTQPQPQQPQPQPQQPQPQQQQPQPQQPQPQPQPQQQQQQPQPQPQQPQPQPLPLPLPLPVVPSIPLPVVSSIPLPVVPSIPQLHLPEIKPGVPIAKPLHPGISSADIEAHKHDFKPGHWKHAHATFYTGDTGSFGGACGYADVARDGYGEGTAALSTTLFHDGQACGACFEIKCIHNPKWCKPGQPSLFITATNFCPPNFEEETHDGGWCNPPREHFDIAYPAFKHIAEYKVGIIPVAYRRVPCKKHGGIRFTITGHKHFTLVSVWNVGGAGDISHVDVKGNDKLNWTPLIRNWGAKWQTTCSLEDECLTFKVTTSDGRSVISPNVTPNKYWSYGHTFEGLNFR